MIGNNVIFNRCFQKWWMWGKRTTYRKPNTPNLGGPVPIWRNDFYLFFYIFAGMNFVIFIFDFLAYMISLSKVSSIDNIWFDLENSIFLQMVFSIMNALFYLYLARKDSAIDQEWSRYMIFMLINFILQIIGVTICLILACMSALSAWNKDWFSEARTAFILLIMSIVFAYILLGFQIVSVFRIRRKLYKDPYELAARKADPDVIIRNTIND